MLIVKLLFINCEIDAGKSCFLTPPYLVFNAVRNFVVYPPFNLEVSRILEDDRLQKRSLRSTKKVTAIEMLRFHRTTSTEQERRQGVRGLYAL